jgi:benzoyl-CoA 2,3-dioxygenase component B
MPEADWEQMSVEWLPSDDDDDYILSLMKPEYRPGYFAPWIAAPKAGIDGKPGDFEYVRIAA